MSDMDIIDIPGYPGMFARRIVVKMWQRAGSPHINDAGRLYATQLEARIKFENGKGSPADDPRRPDKYPLAHVRFAALDVVNSARAAMIAAGFEYPYDYEPWHAQLPNIYAYPLVSEIPAAATSQPFNTEQSEEDEMSDFYRVLTSPSYKAAKQRVVIYRGIALPYPDGWVQDLVTHGRVQLVDYPTDRMLTDELSIMYKLSGLSNDEIEGRMREVFGEVIPEIPKLGEA